MNMITAYLALRTLARLAVFACVGLIFAGYCSLVTR